MSKDKYYVAIRAYPETEYVSVWLCRRNAGGSISGLMAAEMIPGVAEQMAKELGLSVEHETSPTPGGKKVNREKAEVMTKQQRSMFDE